MCTSAIYLITSLPVLGKLLSELSDDKERCSSPVYEVIPYSEELGNPGDELAVSGKTLIVSTFGQNKVLFYQLN